MPNSTSNNSYQICNRCVMDTSDPTIVFDNDGNCNHCSNFVENTANFVYHGQESDQLLDVILQKIKKSGKNKPYDCVIGISGGIDSCYSIYIAKSKGLRPLVVHMDNGWDSEEAVNNIKNSCKILEVDYQSYVLDWQNFKEIQKAFLRASIVDAEIPTDIAIPAALHKIASQNNIKYVISGGNFATEGILPLSWGYYAKDETLFWHIVKKFSTKVVKTFPTFGYKTELYYKFIRGIKTIYLLNYVPFNKKAAMEFLQKELGWKYYGGKHYESKFTGFLQSYILPVKFNVDYRRVTLSTQICTNEVTREEAIKKLENLPYNPEKIEEEIDYICKKLELSKQEFETIMNTPPKSFTDYPNEKGTIEFIYKAYKKIFKKGRF